MTPSAIDNGLSAHDGLGAEVQRLALELESANQRLRRNLAEREQMQSILLSTLQSLTCGVLAIGQDGIVIVANPAACRLLGRDLAEIATRHIEDALPDFPQSGDLLLTLQGAGGGQSRAVWTPESPNGDQRRIQLTAVRALPPNDRQLAGLVLLEDQTEIARLEAQAQLRSRLTGMGEIAMNLAHEIRNPLGSIELFATTLEHELAPAADLAQLAAQITQGVKSLEHVVANTLEFAKPRRISLARVCLNRIVADALIYVRHPLEQHGIQVNYAYDMLPEAWIAGDGEQLRQVFLNLFLNAIQAMDEGGSIDVAIEATGNGGWRVAIADEGVGIPEEMLGRIFDPFFSTREKGSGLGLAIVHRIVAAHGGRVEVQSRVAAGTRFSVVLPGGDAVKFAQAAAPEEDSMAITGPQRKQS